jgi:acyl carrier protein
MTTEMEIFALIEDALGLEPGSIKIDSNDKNISEWDSLGHFAILSALDGKYDDITIGSPELVEATSVDKIVKLVNERKT